MPWSRFFCLSAMRTGIMASEWSGSRLTHRSCDRSRRSCTTALPPFAAAFASTCDIVRQSRENIIAKYMTESKTTFARRYSYRMPWREVLFNGRELLRTKVPHLNRIGSGRIAGAKTSIQMQLQRDREPNCHCYHALVHLWSSSLRGVPESNMNTRTMGFHCGRAELRSLEVVIVASHAASDRVSLHEISHASFRYLYRLHHLRLDVVQRKHCSPQAPRPESASKLSLDYG